MNAEEREKLIEDGPVYITAPARPFPWWGEFNLVNVFGRIYILFSLIILSLTVLLVFKEGSINTGPLVMLLIIPVPFAIGVALLY